MTEKKGGVQAQYKSRALLSRHGTWKNRSGQVLFAFLFAGFVALATSWPLLANDGAATPVNRLASVLGADVRSSGKTVGRIVDLLARPDGTVEAAVVEYGGLLGIGSRKVAVGWSHLRFERDGKQLVAVTDLTPDELASSSDY